MLRSPPTSHSTSADLQSTARLPSGIFCLICVQAVVEISLNSHSQGSLSVLSFPAHLPAPPPWPGCSCRSIPGIFLPPPGSTSKNHPWDGCQQAAESARGNQGTTEPHVKAVRRSGASRRNVCSRQCLPVPH